MKEKKYELIVLARPELTNKELEQLESKIKSLLTNNGANNMEVEHWGRRQITMKLNKYSSAHYTAYYFTSDACDLVKNINQQLRITEEVIKFQFHKEVTKARKFQGNPLKLKEAA